jgi:hypothetical protein
MEINRVGEKGNLATLWNAATYLVDRRGDGTKRGNVGLESMLFGTRQARVQEIQTMIEVILADGTIAAVEASKAVEMGVDSKLVGAKILEEMLQN